MIAAIVELVLQENPESRDSDKKCLIQVWERLGLYLSKAQQDKFMGIASPETIRRTRQKIQESGRWLASDKVYEQRKFKALRVQQMIAKTKADKVDDLVSRVEPNPLFSLPITKPKQEMEPK